ncbi:hypothetical protein O0I10_007966 [Lichtheimia ornata]|uniref:Uncharacterized protein n=1 Tax=Lichtheimia ornata TaxID=688661 RepID=A0AAD7V0G8_9FUNG|nr:uncharacterized protein O0I10_007966 [Lichtheimia ornata]KAJ8656398.1 hypothetical protein O0I10_007966 [Lichtheimia ornata]
MDITLCTSCWNALGAFDYAATNRILARLLRVYQPMSNLLGRLSNCESLYTQLSFLKPKWYYVRKDPLHSLYTYLAEDAAKEIAILESNSGAAAATGINDIDTILDVLKALTDVCRIRQSLITLYQAIGAAQHPSTFTTILRDLESCKQTYESMDSDRLGLLGLGIRKEICILQSLLKARQAIIDYAFQESCMAVFVCKQQLNDWKVACQNQDYAEKFSASGLQETRNTTSSLNWRNVLFGGLSDTPKTGDNWPHSIRWFTKYLDNLIAKMTLYFNNILLAKEQILTEDDAGKALWKGIKIDYYDQISTFRKRFGAHCIGLIYEVTPSVPFYPQGYVCSGTPYEPPQGIHSFPFIYCHPNQTPKEHMPNIISIIQGSRNKLNDPKAGPVYFYDNKITSTYYLSRVDERVVLIVIYLERHVHREAATTEFMTNMVISLRETSVIGDLSRMDY